MLHNAPNNTIPTTAATARVTNVDTILTILYGTIGAVAGALAVVLAWKGLRVLRQRNARP
jgi:hypothetical protein